MPPRFCLYALHDTNILLSSANKTNCPSSDELIISFMLIKIIEGSIQNPGELHTLHGMFLNS